VTLARCWSVAVVGVDGRIVEVEVDIGNGLPAFVLVGLPDTSVAESRDRVRAAIVNSGEAWPDRRITVGLSPATLPKSGSHFDLAVALAVLGAAGRLDLGPFRDAVVLGELGLDGRVRAVRGVLPALLGAARAGRTRALVPGANATEARLVPDLDVLAVSSLREVLALLRGDPLPDPGDSDAAELGSPGTGATTEPEPPELDLADVAGQVGGRYAVEVAAAGGHHLSLVGPPGIGKTMLAARLPGLLPDLAVPDALEVVAIHSVAGALSSDRPLDRRPPYGQPHHTATVSSLVGGGSRMPRPGAASLAHHGVLFLDEVPEFSPAALDALRQPLENGEVVIARSQATVRFPARFQLVTAANPCPCGNFVGRGDRCTCPPPARRRYASRVSGPVRDRIDIHRALVAPTRAELRADLGAAEPSSAVRPRVEAARRLQTTRYAGTPWRCNGHVPGPDLRRYWPASSTAMAALTDQLAAGALTARGADRVLRIAWTLADLVGTDRPGLIEVQTAGELRGLPAVRP